MYYHLAVAMEVEVKLIEIVGRVDDRVQTVNRNWSLRVGRAEILPARAVIGWEVRGETRGSLQEERMLEYDLLDLKTVHCLLGAGLRH